MGQYEAHDGRNRLSLTCDLSSVFVNGFHDLRKIAKTLVTLCKLSCIPVNREETFLSQRMVVDVLEFFIHVSRIYLDCTRNAMLLGADQFNKMLLGDIVESRHFCVLCQS